MDLKIKISLIDLLRKIVLFNLLYSVPFMRNPLLLIFTIFKVSKLFYSNLYSHLGL
jgi:hypothetical protein